MDWSTLGCSRYGHITYAPDEPELRAQLKAAVADGEAWRCLRCATFVSGPPDASGPAAAAPVVPRGKEFRSKLILRVFAIERFVRAAIFYAAAFLLWHFRGSHASIERAFNRELPVLRGLFRELGFNIDHSKLVGLLRDALTLSSHTLTLLAIGAALYATIEVVEAVGLWQARRWGEYFAMVATSLGLPLEIYDLTKKVTWLALLLLAVNLLLVLYLAITKRLFGIRGGKAAYDARLREESVLEAAVVAARRQAEPAPAGESATAADAAPAAHSAPPYSASPRSASVHSASADNPADGATGGRAHAKAGASPGPAAPDDPGAAGSR